MFSRVAIKAQPVQSVNLGHIVREVLSDLEERIQQTEGRVEVDGLPTIDADPMQMRQLFMNLVSNGLKFHRPGVPPVVKVSGRQQGEADCQIVVEDNGIGFEEKYTDRIFDVFQRLHGRQYEGTGMGLAICRKIVQQHGGSIAANSIPGQGSTFTITLPSGAPRRTTFMTTNLKPVVILMAEDDPDDRLLTEQALKESLLINDLRFVENGEELLDYLNQRGKYVAPAEAPRPSVILLDLNMPRKDGREALQELKHDVRFRHIPIVVLTTSQAEEDIFRSYDLGANSYITKPVTFEGLVAVMRTLGDYWLELVELPAGRKGG